MLRVCTFAPSPLVSQNMQKLVKPKPPLCGASEWHLTTSLCPQGSCWGPHSQPHRAYGLWRRCPRSPRRSSTKGAHHRPKRHQQACLIIVHHQRFRSRIYWARGPNFKLPQLHHSFNTARTVWTKSNSYQISYKNKTTFHQETQKWGKYGRKTLMTKISSSWSSLLAQQVTEPALSLPWRSFDPWPGEFHVPQAKQKVK